MSPMAIEVNFSPSFFKIKPPRIPMKIIPQKVKSIEKPRPAHPCGVNTF